MEGKKNNMKTIGSNFSGGKNRSCTFGSSCLFELIFFIAKKMNEKKSQCLVIRLRQSVRI
jgi:hypothetical protein